MRTDVLLSYHNDEAVKQKYLDRVRQHREADELKAGVGFKTNAKVRGCAVGCTFDQYDHSRGPIEIGVQEHLIRLEDAIFEGLAATGQDYLSFPESFLSCINVGSDLSLVWPKFAYWLLSASDSPLGKHVSRQYVSDVAYLYRQWIDTGLQPNQEKFKVAARAAEAAWMAEAAEAARAAEAAARAAWVTEAATWAAEAAAGAAAEAAWAKMRNKLLELLQGEAMS